MASDKYSCQELDLHSYTIGLNGPFVRTAEIDAANLAAPRINGRFSLCGAANNFGVRIAACASK